MDQEQTREASIVFFGTPAFAATILEALHNAADLYVKGVITQPDRPCGRGQARKPSAVKEYAQAQGYYVLQPESLKSEEIKALLRSLQADFFVVAAYGLLLPQVILNIPRLECLNVHASLLPKHRGASPIQAALLSGDEVAGITIMRMVAAMDAGPILLQRAMAIGLDDTAQTLHDKLAGLGARLIVEALRGYLCGALTFSEQNHSLATYAPKLTKEQGQIDWNRPARDVHNHIRAMHPWPGAFFFLQGATSAPRKIIVHPGDIGDAVSQDIAPGSFLGLDKGRLAIACDDRAYLVSRLHPSDAKPMNAQAFFCGYQRYLASRQRFSRQRTEDG
jgi:methionyl-tRNA formyltransferase